MSSVLHCPKAQADIGHSRAHAQDLTKPWPMGKCAPAHGCGPVRALRF